MKIAVDKNAPIPAYKQVVDGVAEAIGRGDVERGSRLPSVRNLAHDLGLNVNTVARAYRDLERAGVIRTMPGMGSFVPDDGASSPAWSSSPVPGTARAIRGAGPGLEADHGGLDGPLPSSWQDWLAAAHSLARAEGVSRDAFLERARALAGRPVGAAPLVVVGAAAGEALDLLKALPSELVGDARVVEADGLAEAVSAGGVSAVLTSFPAQAGVRSRLGAGDAVPEVVPVETEYSEATVRDLSLLPPDVRLALVTVEKACWDNEANDVMKIIGRTRWLKTVFLEHAERGLAERLAQVDVVLHVPRAREPLEALGVAGERRVELVRQSTARTRRRLDAILAAPRA
jgi:DNA-binding transcriptional regulator YhcF (GntR family)